MIKILLALMGVGGIYTIYFIINEYKKFYKSQKAEEGSMLERFIIAILAFSGIGFIVFITTASIVFLFSKIIIELPF